MKILETERTILFELTKDDAGFMLDLLNQPSFIKYIGDRNVRTFEESIEFIETRYRKSYLDNGYGLYGVKLKEGQEVIGICGFVKRADLEFADIGFAFLPQFGKKGYAFETADAVMKYGEDVLGFEKVLAITTQDNESSVKLLDKLGFKFEKLIKMPTDENELNLFSKTAEANS
jgi:RimJ/RimL family protein N-acetyltransferase